MVMPDSILGPAEDEDVVNLQGLPFVYLLTAKLTEEEVHRWEDLVISSGLALTHDARNASWLLTKLESARRSMYELRCLGLDVVQISELEQQQDFERLHQPTSGASSTDKSLSHGPDGAANFEISKCFSFLGGRRLLSIVKLDWLTDSIAQSQALPLWPYVLAIARKDPPQLDGAEESLHQDPRDGILQRVREDPVSQEKLSHMSLPPAHKLAEASRRRAGHFKEDTEKPALLRQSTSEFDATFHLKPQSLPKWVLEGKKYSCERPTPAVCSNQTFVDQLSKIRKGRVLTEDEVGVRAYSSAMAAIAAFDRPLESSAEVLALPGCSKKIAHLFHLWKQSPSDPLEAVQDLEDDEQLRTIGHFNDIWGIGVKTARSFERRGWKDIDDIVEFGWAGLQIGQQIGVKFFDDFQEPISRSEAKAIGEVVVRQARRVRDERVEYMMVGGFRRGKATVHDVDIILSSPELDSTRDLVLDVVLSLEDVGYVTHTLHLSTQNSDRGQQPHPIRAPTSTRKTFADTLDKAFVVWRDIHFSGESNTNRHRRVDIIVAPWPSVGCAVIGWSGGVTYERDLRRYVKHRFNWRFDSSGIRDRSTGAIVSLEENARTMHEAEQMVYQGLDLPWLEPTERCAD